MRHAQILKCSFCRKDNYDRELHSRGGRKGYVCYSCAKSSKSYVPHLIIQDASCSFCAEPLNDPELLRRTKGKPLARIAPGLILCTSCAIMAEFMIRLELRLPDPPGSQSDDVSLSQEEINSLLETINKPRIEKVIKLLTPEQVTYLEKTVLF